MNRVRVSLGHECQAEARVCRISSMETALVPESP